MSQTIPIRSLTTFRFTWSATQSTRTHQAPSHKVPNNALRLLEINDRKQPKGLWWSMQKVPSSQCSKSTVRNWATRRVREAFVEALRANGFNEYGLVMEGARFMDDEHSLKGLRKEYMKELHGSLVLRVDASAVTATKEKLDSEARSLVNWLHGVGRPFEVAAAVQQRTKRANASGTHEDGRSSRGTPSVRFLS